MPASKNDVTIANQIKREMESYLNLRGLEITPDSKITYLLLKLARLQKRIDKLETPVKATKSKTEKKK